MNFNSKLWGTILQQFYHLQKHLNQKIVLIFWLWKWQNYIFVDSEKLFISYGNQVI